MLIAIGNSGAKLVGGFMLVSAVHKYVGDEYINYFNAASNWLAVCASVAETIPNFSAKEKKEL